MRSVLRFTGIVLLASSVSAAVADPAYVGKWKLNTAKSDFGQLTATYAAVPGGFKATMDGVSYTFTTDGKEVATPWGTMQSVKAINATTWEATSKVNGKLFSTDTIKVSADGKSMTVESKMVQPNGGTGTSTMTFQRTAGTTGLAGTWKAAKMSTTTSGLLEIAVKAADGIVLKFIDQNATCDGKFDGKPHPATGAIFPAGWTCTFSKNTPTGFSVAFSKDGKGMYASTFTVSADGKTLTENGGAVNTTEKTKAVYEKQ
jgi:hypothetical protein